MAAKATARLEEIAELEIRDRSAKVEILAIGTWIAASVGNIDARLRKLEAEIKARKQVPALVVDLSRLKRMDTYGAWLVRRICKAWQERGFEATISTENEEYRTLLRAVNCPDIETLQRPHRKNFFIRFLYQLGKTVHGFERDFILALNLIGSAIRGPQLKTGMRSGIRFTAIVFQIDRMGVRAIPIISLMAFLIGAIIAQQGAYQLRYFGAEIFVVDLAAILLLREIGVLLTAIMVSGRTGSAMTAEIGSMKMREEVDALQVIGLNPVGVLVFPRLVALTIVLPLLTFVADMTSLAGAAVVALLYSGISLESFVTKMQEAVDLSTILSGLIKAPFMALIIGIISAIEGLKVEGSAESMGRRTTAAVVKSIFFVIVVDGLFAIFYAQIGY